MHERLRAVLIRVPARRIKGINRTCLHLSLKSGFPNTDGMSLEETKAIVLWRQQIVRPRCSTVRSLLPPLANSPLHTRAQDSSLLQSFLLAANETKTPREAPP